MKANTKKLIIGGSAALIVAVVAILIIKKKKTSSLLGGKSVGDPSGSSSQKVNGVLYPLKYGSGYNNLAENEVVKKLQQALNVKMKYKPYLDVKELDVDGKFGPKTEAACEALLGVKQVSYSLYQELVSSAALTVISFTGGMLGV
jgi:peptidoglycan hydrolase-like protein with peptidoglycan-binding domain